MKKKYIKILPFVGDNNLDAWVPEVWANEALMILEEDLILANLVHRDFENEIAREGDTVNATRPNKFTAKRKTGASVVTQDAIGEQVPVVLDQLIHTSFLIDDKDYSLARQDLFDTYLTPAVISIAEGIERVLAYQLYAFRANRVGKLGTAPTKTTLNAAKTKANKQLIPNDGNRYMILDNDSEGALTNEELFVSAEKVGDDGTALRQGSLGYKYSWHCINHSLMPSVSVDPSNITTGAINNTGGYPAGTKTFTVDGLSAAIANGSYLTIAGDDTPLRVVSTVGGATPTSITVDIGINSAVDDDAVVSIVDPILVNNVAGYGAGSVGDIIYDGSGAPATGQLVGADYGLWEVDTTNKKIKTNRALDAALADDAVLGLGPAGNYSFGFHKNAIALVSRPLAVPRHPNVNGAVVNYNGLAIRVVFTYDGVAQATRCTVDTLCGTKVLDYDLGLVLLG